MLNFGASKPRVRGGPGPPGTPLDPHLKVYSFHTHPIRVIAHLFNLSFNLSFENFNC